MNKPDSVDYYIDKLALLNEQLLVSKAEKQTAELETKYQTEKKERLIQKSKAEIATRELEIKRKETQFLILGLISLALLIIIYLVYLSTYTRAHTHTHTHAHTTHTYTNAYAYTRTHIYVLARMHGALPHTNKRAQIHGHQNAYKH